MISFIALICVHLVAAVIILIRNHFVFHERNNMIDLVFAQQDWRKYCDLFDRTGYNAMVFCFWIYPVGRMWVPELQALKKVSK